MLKLFLEIHFGVIQNCIAVIFEILIFCNFSWGQNSNFSVNGKNLNSWKIVKIQNVKNHRNLILYHPEMYLHIKFEHQRICSFLDQSRFMWNLIIFSTKCIFPYTLSGETIYRAKFSSPNKKFITFAQRQISPNKSKSVYGKSEVSLEKVYLRGKQVI